MVCIACSACSSTGGGLLPSFNSLRDQGGATVGTARADWDDIDAALDVGLYVGECAVLSDDRPRHGVQCSSITYQLTTVGGEPGSVTISRTVSDRPDPRGPETIEIRASIGRYRDRDREQRLIEATIRRLEALAGVDWAPIPGSPFAN